MMKVFISYSHKDEAALELLHTQLAVLQRDGCIDEWFDRKIFAGGRIDTEINERLECSELYLLLVSPDFLASDFCMEREMKRALERHRSGEARVIPIIIEHCDWASTPLRDLKALPRDGKPVSEWTNENNAYLDVVQELRRVLAAEEVPQAAEHGEAAGRAAPGRSGVHRYRAKRDFDEIDCSDFLEEAFGFIRDYFKRAIAEIDTIEDLRGRFVSLSADSFTCTIVNRARKHGTAHITVHGRIENVSCGDISYSFTKNGSPNLSDGSFTIKADEYELYLSSMMMSWGSQGEKLTPATAAQQLWEEFLQKAGVSSD